MTHIFVGYLLVFFDITVNGIDLLPNFLGYALIFIGLGKLAEKSVCFAKGKPWALGLAVFTALVQVIRVDFPVSYVLFTLAAVAGLYLMYQIDHGVLEMEQAEGLDLGADKLIEIWKLQAIFHISCSFPSFGTGALLGLLIVAGFVTNVIFLVRFYRTKKAYESAHT